MSEAIQSARSLAQATLSDGSGRKVAERFALDVEDLLREQLTLPSGVAVLAQGGLGRGELAPFADVDLLFVADDDAQLEALELGPLWDLGMRVGHAVCTTQVALARAEDDHHAATALLESRPLVGETDLATRLIEGALSRLHKRRAQFVQDKLTERDARRARFGDAVYLVEPNTKRSPGGLRDLHTLLWVGRALAGPDAEVSLAGLFRHGFLNEREHDALRQSHDELLLIRCALHLAAERAEDRLLFVLQEPVAEVLGCAPGERGQRAEDALMHRYFQAAQSMRRGVDEALERMTLAPSGSTLTRRVDAHFCARGPYLFPEDPSYFEGGLARVIDAVRAAAEQDLRLSPRARQQVYRAVQAPDWDDPGVGRAILRLASVEQDEREPEGTRPFTELLESGALGAALRDIARLRWRFKHDGYHAYTTDAHIARCADLAWRAAAGIEEIPAPLKAAWDRTRRRHLVVLGAIFHDIGKGLPGDHSLTGAQIALREARRMRLPEEEQEILIFLVEEHLELSRASQRRDLSDPEVVKDLAARCETVERLDLLALVTWVDVASVAPGMFTDWKARLLGLAVERVRAFLRDPTAGGALRQEREAVLRARSRTQLEERTGAEIAQRFVRGASEHTLRRRLRAALIEDAEAFATYTGEPVARARLAAGGHAHHVRVVCEERAGLFADLASAIAEAGANLLHANVGSRSDGLAVTAFRVDDGNDEALEDDIVNAVTHALLHAAVHGSERLPSRPRQPPPGLRTYVRFSLDADSEDTVVVIEVRAADRPGLAADIARQIADAGYEIALAKLDTEGVAARDTFFVVPLAGANRAALENGIRESALSLPEARP